MIVSITEDIKRILNILIIILIFSTKLAAQEIITDRPDQTESSTSIPWKSIQIEAGLQLSNSKDFGISEKEFVFPTVLFRYGVFRRIELRMVNQLERVKNESLNYSTTGFSDIELGVKFQILKKEDINTQIAFLTHLVIPSAKEGISNDKFGMVNKIAVSHNLSDNIGLGYNLGYDYFGTGKGNLIYSAAVGWGLSDRFSVYAETFGAAGEFSDWIVNIDAGATFLIQNNLQLDFSFGTGLNHKMNYLSLGFSWNIGIRAE